MLIQTKNSDWTRQAHRHFPNFLHTGKRIGRQEDLLKCCLDSFWDIQFWLYWQTMFAFQRWSSALEMKRYLCRYVHHIDGLPDFSALRFTKYNQYESLIMPLVNYLTAHGVQIEYGMDVKNVVIETVGDKKIARQIVYIKDGEEQTLDLVEDDLVIHHKRLLHRYFLLRRPDHVPDFLR